MDRNEILELYKTIKNPTKDKATIYKLLDALNIPYKKTSCGKCLNDLYNILGEELGQIENAAEVSDFNTEKAAKTYKYTHGRAVILNGKKYGEFSGQSDLEELYKKVGAGYVSVVWLIITI